MPVKPDPENPETSDFQLLAAFHHLSPNPLIAVDADGRVTFASEAAERTLEPLGPGVSAAAFFPPDMESVLALLRRGESGSLQRDVEFGGRVFAENVLVRPDQDAVFIHATDITELRRAEQELRRQESFLRALVESPTDIQVFAVDRECHYTAFNTAHRREMKKTYCIDIVSGMKLSDAITAPEVRTRIEQAVARALDGESFTSVEFDPDLDVWHEFDWNPVRAADGTVEGVAAFGRDITRRKRVEELLADSEERYRRLVEETGEGIAVTDTEERFTLVNRAADEMFGMPHGSLVGRNLCEFLDRNQAAVVRRQTTERRAGRTGSYDLEITRPDGTKRTAMVTASPQHDTQGHFSGSFGIFRDITERRQYRVQVEAERDRLRRILDAMPDGVYMVGQDWQLQYVNPSLLARGGPVKGRKCYEYFHGRSEPCPDCANPQAFAGTSTHREYTTRQGSVTYDIQDVPVTGDDGNPARLVFLRDITERKSAELRDKQHLADTTLLRDTALGFITLDPTANIYGYVARRLAQLAGEAYIVVNSYDATRGEFRVRAIQGIGDSAQAALKLLGQPPAGMMFRLAPDELHRYTSSRLMKIDGGLPALSSGELPEVVSDAIRSVFMLGDTYVMSLYWQGRILGTVYILMHKDVPLRDPALVEAFVNQAAIAIQHRHDADELVRHREHLEELVRERTVELEAANRELEAFSYSVSHDLRAPLRAIDGFAQALAEERGKQMDTQARADLDRVSSAAQRMAQLIDDLLDLARIARLPLERREVDLSGIVRNITAELKRSAPDRRVEVAVPDGLVAPADPVLAEMVLRNLLDNAWKFTSKHPTARIEFGTMRGSGQTPFFVRDDGVGCDMTYADKLFAPFQRLHTEHDFPGTGIGLAIVQRIVRRHGGRVWIEAEPDGGFTCWFTLEPAPKKGEHGREAREGNTAD